MRLASARSVALALGVVAGCDRVFGLDPLPDDALAADAASGDLEPLVFDRHELVDLAECDVDDSLGWIVLTARPRTGGDRQLYVAASADEKQGLVWAAPQPVVIDGATTGAASSPRWARGGTPEPDRGYIHWSEQSGDRRQLRYTRVELDQPEQSTAEPAPTGIDDEDDLDVAAGNALRADQAPASGQPRLVVTLGEGPELEQTFELAEYQGGVITTWMVYKVVDGASVMPSTVRLGPQALRPRDAFLTRDLRELYFAGRSADASRLVLYRTRRGGEDQVFPVAELLYELPGSDVRYPSLPWPASAPTPPYLYVTLPGGCYRKRIAF